MSGLTCSGQKLPRIIIDTIDGDGLVPADTRQLAFVKEVKVDANHELRVMVEPIDNLLCVAVPDKSAHIVGATC